MSLRDTINIYKGEFDMIDNVNHPSHYNTGEIEVINYIKDKLTYEGFLGYLNGNILKYISRWQFKNGLEDLQKAQWYLNYMINYMVEYMETVPNDLTN